MNQEAARLLLLFFIYRIEGLHIDYYNFRMLVRSRGCRRGCEYSDSPRYWRRRRRARRGHRRGRHYSQIHMFFHIRVTHCRERLRLIPRRFQNFFQHGSERVLCSAWVQVRSQNLVLSRIALFIEMSHTAARIILVRTMRQHPDPLYEND